jgi:hypothetical protein
MMRRGLIGLGLCFSFGMINFFLPAVDAADSPRVIVSKIRELTKHTVTPLYQYGLTQEDLIYYLNADPQIPRLQTYQQVVDKATKRNILIVTDRSGGQGLMKKKNLVVKTLEEFSQPRGRKFLLLSIGRDPQKP